MNTKVQNILIVGAKSDIARAIAREYARQGQSIHLVARNSVTVEKEVADLKIRGAAEVILWSLDLSK
jgi:decaprenylphospho-beta-D-erythro-pentofuranosid-2-ulose 2-reductase